MLGDINMLVVVNFSVNPLADLRIVINVTERESKIFSSKNLAAEDFSLFYKKLQLELRREKL